jgi:hypothetical protein
VWDKARRLANAFIFGRVGPDGEPLPDGGCEEKVLRREETAGGEAAAMYENVLFVDDLDALEILCAPSLGSGSGELSALQLFSQILRPAGSNGTVSRKTSRKISICMYWRNRLISST